MKYLVVGRIPHLSQAASDNEKQQFRQIIAHHKKMVAEARETAVRRINLSDFLAHIGYVPRRRLFFPRGWSTALQPEVRSHQRIGWRQYR
ncbi:MAG: hypothetical protein CM1200mP2_09130 [Planctomycetaceae bacterium]|nr:MAG: hypothetical protein CM1200mP2_09130 [Planctomycetaceae bacterium]